MKELEEARAALARGEYKQATEACTRAIERAPENLEARIVLVELCLACQRIDDALTVGEYILSQAGKAAEALQEAQREELQEAFAPYGRYASQRLAQRFPRVLAFLRARGILPAVETEMQEETAAQCETETRRKTETHHETERLAAAVSPRQEADAQEYLSSLPPAARIQSLRAEAGNYLVQGDAAAADTCLRQALFLDGKDDATLRARAIALWAMGRTQEALDTAGKCSLTDFSLLAKLQQTPPASAKDKAKNQEQQGKRKKLLVFLPVDASMWDSLDSVWRAAAADPEHCRTLVIPLPFSDRNPDYSETVWQCDAADYPDDVPVEDWHDYPMERLMAMHPDVIFINIPYDDCNYVYSVDAQYYSRNLKYCTDNLVYIPYFVMGDTIPVNFCQVPAVIHADHVIVQDENIKRQYEQNYPDGTPPEGKFLALGSPKFDHVLRAREEFTLPEAWQRIIKGRKVILYNTSVTSALTNTAYVCRKLRSVLAYFKNRKDIAFWWRPHPFMEATLRSMRPSILQEYIAIRKQYQEEAWGIYDDTADLDRAIVCSDAYYGDMSSVVWLYRATGKPIMIEDYMICDNKGYAYPYSFMQGSAGEFYFVDGHYGVIEKLSIGKKHAELVEIIPRTLARDRFAFGYMDQIADEVFVFPVQEKYVLSYSACQKKFQKVVEFTNGYSTYRRLLTSFCYQGIHIYLPLQSDHILLYQEKERKWEILTDWFSLLQPYLARNQEKIDTAKDILEKNIFTDACQVGPDVYMTVPLGQCVLHLNMMTKKSEVLQMGGKDSICYGIAYDGTNFWMTAEGNQLIQWQPSRQRYEQYSLPSGNEAQAGYRQIFFDGEKLILFPAEKGSILHIDLLSQKVTVGPQVEQPLVYADILGVDRYGWLEFGWTYKDTNPSLDKYSMFCLYDHGTVNKYPIRGEDLERQQAPERFSYQGVFYENIGCTMQKLSQIGPIRQPSENQNYGRLIYQSVRQGV